MFSLAPSSQQQYDHVPTSDASLGTDSPEEKCFVAARPRSSFAKAAVLTLTSIAGIAGIFALVYLPSSHQQTKPYPVETPDQSHGYGHTHAHQSKTCTQPYFRREWRSLSTNEKSDYVAGFQCLIDSPSVLGLDGSLYNDFSWVHNLVAYNTHTKAPFLTWHRRFIFVYETYLRESCGYKGALPFWDWTLDWEDLPNSPIFDSKLGFGGDGDPKAPKHQSAHCVTDAPFRNLTPQWYGEKHEPHCLTRWFSEDWFGHYLNPEALEKVMAKTTYADFFLALEMGPHDIVPMGIRGDFTTFTAPNDPIFYLHHAQLDRVWWLWQLRDKENRVHSYGGEGNGGGNVSLTDALPLAGLGRDVTVAQIMDTEGGDMCYRYMYL